MIINEYLFLFFTLFVFFAALLTFVALFIKKLKNVDNSYMDGKFDFWKLLIAFFASNVGGITLLRNTFANFNLKSIIFVKSLFVIIGLIFTVFVVLFGALKIPKFISIGGVGEKYYGVFARLLFSIIWIFTALYVIIFEINLLINFIMGLVDKSSVIVVIGFFTVLIYSYMASIHLFKNLRLFLIIIVMPIIFCSLFKSDTVEIFNYKNLIISNKLLDIKFFFYTLLVCPLLYICSPIIIEKTHGAASVRTVYKALFSSVFLLFFTLLLSFLVVIVLCSKNTQSLYFVDFISLMIESVKTSYLKAFVIIGILTAIFASIELHLNSIISTIVCDLVYPINLYLERISDNIKVDIKKALCCAKHSIVILGILSFFIAQSFYFVYYFLNIIAVLWIVFCSIPIASIYMGRVLNKKDFYLYTALNSFIIILSYFILPMIKIVSIDNYLLLFYNAIFALVLYVTLYMIRGRNTYKDINIHEKDNDP